MAAIVMNTLSGAVTEYNWSFQSITAQRAGSASGLFTLGGNTDAGAQIVGEVRSGKYSGSGVLGVGNVYITTQGGGDGTLIVLGRTASWEYPLADRASGVSKGQPGLGIRESHLGFGYRNVAGADFILERIDAEVVPSTTRKA